MRSKEETTAAIRALFSEIGKVTEARREYREARSLRKGLDIDAIADDWYYWMQVGEQSLLRYHRPSMRLKVMHLMRVLDYALGRDDD